MSGKSRIKFSSRAFKERLRKIDEPKNKGDWFSAFANAVTYFEHYGYWRLQAYCLKEGMNLETKLKGLRVSRITLILYLLKLIDTNTFSTMNMIIKERNKLIHPTIAGIRYRNKKEKDRAIQLLEDAKLCLTKSKEGIRIERK